MGFVLLCFSWFICCLNLFALSSDTQASLAGMGEDGTLSGQDGGTNDGQAVLPTTPLTPTSSNNLGFVLGASLPAILASLMACIKKREFVELRGLLPEAIGEAFLLQQSGKNSRKPPMVDKLVDWLLAYSCYASVLVDAEGHLAPQMLLYRASVVCLAWLSCDRAFRQKMAASKSSNWGTMDHELWAMAIGPQKSLLIQRSLPKSSASRRYFLSCDAFKWHQCDRPYCMYPHVCSSCGRPGHQAPSCSLSSTPQPYGGQGSHPPRGSPPPPVAPVPSQGPPPLHRW